MDSAAKHTMACRVDENLMMEFATDIHSIARNKHRYNVNRHEMVLNSGKLLEGDNHSKRPTAYPLVVSNFADITLNHQVYLQLWYAVMQRSQDIGATQERLKAFTRDLKKSKILNKLDFLPFFKMQGYSLGVASANHLSGDIMTSVQVGGMLTVRNGDFACETGQMVQWYFDFEKGSFHEEDGGRDPPHQCGERKPIFEYNQDVPAEMTELVGMFLPDVPANVRSGTRAQNLQLSRKRFFDREYGASDKSNSDGVKKNVFLPKPYVPGRYCHEHWGDKIRVFGKCLNGGRANDMIDVMMMTQSM